VVRLDRLYLVCPRCHAARHPLDERLGVGGFVSPHAQRLLCLAGASWSFDRAGANLKEFCGLSVSDNTIRSVCHEHGGAMRDWQRDDPAATGPFRRADGDAEFQTDGTCVNTTGGWREMRLSIFAKRHRGEPASGPRGWEQRDLPAPHARVVQAGIRTGEQLGAGWWRMAVRLGLSDTTGLTVLADGARWIWGQVADHLPGATGVLDIYHATEHLWAAANTRLGEGTAAARAWVGERRRTLLRGGATALRAELAGVEWGGLRGYFEPHADHTGYAARLRRGQSIGSGLVEGACKQVIGRRLKQTGARWKVRRVERMATLCGVQAGDQWDAYWAGKT
jgi:hypothetical protein